MTTVGTSPTAAKTRCGVKKLWITGSCLDPERACMGCADFADRLISIPADRFSGKTYQIFLRPEFCKRIKQLNHFRHGQSNNISCFLLNAPADLRRFGHIGRQRRHAPHHDALRFLHLRVFQTAERSRVVAEVFIARRYRSKSKCPGNRKDG